MLYNIDWDPSEKHPIFPNNVLFNETIEYLTSQRDEYEKTVPNGIENQNLRGSNTKYVLCCDNNSTAKYPEYPNCTCNPENWSQFTCNPVCYDKDSCGEDNLIIQRFSSNIRINRRNGEYININSIEKARLTGIDNINDEIKLYYHGNDIGFKQEFLFDNGNINIIQQRNDMINKMKDYVDWIWYDGQFININKYRNM